MLTGSSASPFAAIELAVYKTLFTGYSPYAALTGEVNKERMDNGAGNTASSAATTKESSKNVAAGKRTAVSSAKLPSGALEAKEESENAETSSCKKTD